MAYSTNQMPNSINIDGIYTVLKVDYSKTNIGIGESHPFPEINFLTKGRHCAIIDGKEHTIDKGSLSIIAPGTFHKSARTSNSEALIVSFESSSPILSDIYGIRTTLTERQENEYCSLVEMGLKLFKVKVGGSMEIVSGASNYDLEIFKKRLELFLLDLHRCYAKPKTKISSRRDSEFKEVKNYLINNIEKVLSLEDIADANFICVSKLKGIFKEKGGVKNYFTTLKIEKAKEYIIEGKLNFTEISEKLGFSSLHYFSKTFKKLTGINPSEYQKGKGLYY